MSPSIESAQSQWIIQLASMRNAIAELKLDEASRDVKPYGHNLTYDDDVSGGSSSDDIWDMNSDNDDDEYSSDLLDGPEKPYTNGYSDEVQYGNEWLEAKLTTFGSRGSGLGMEELQEQVLALLASDSIGTLIPLFLYL